LPALVEFGLSFTDLTDENMDLFASFPSLEVLDISYTQISEHGLRHLVKAPRLRELYIEEGPLSDAAKALLPSVTIRRM
jgi:hypothetical protein